MKTILSFLTVAVIAVKTFAQQPTAPPAPLTPPSPPDPPRKEKVESMRIAFLTQKLDLSPEEAQKFWPVYNEFHKKREELHKKRKEEMKSAKQNFDSLSDKQVEKIVDDEMIFRQKNFELEKEYHSKFKSVLPIKKVAKLYHAEDMFARHLLDKISEHGEHGGKRKGMNPPPPPEGNEEH